MERFLRHLSISNKLAGVFLILLMMMGIGGLVGLYNARQLTKVTERLYLDSFKRAETMQSIENEFLTARQEMFLAAVITDAPSRSYLDVSIAEHRSKIDRLLAEYKNIGGGVGDGMYAALLGNLEGYWRIQARVEQLTRGGDRKAALSVIRMEGSKGFSDTVESIRTLIKEERGKAYDEYQRSNFFAKVIIAVTLALTLIAILLAVILWFTLIRLIVRPILAIEESARKIGQGMLQQRVPVMNEDEIGNLAVEFNKMASSLENYYNTLEKKVGERTEELKLANEELRTKKRELESANMRLTEANRMKSQFLANVSHELRTPLNSIIGFSELLLEKAFGDLNDRQTQYVQFVHSSGEHLLQLINNILDLSKIEAGRMELVAEVFPLTEAIGETLGIVRPIAHKRGITIETKTVAASPKLLADKAKFKQIMLNLLTNAIKFNVDNGMVTIDWEVSEVPDGLRVERSLVLKVKDTGIGIRGEDKDKLFREFGQLDSSITREYGGTGLGLVLTKRLVELHKGAIWFESVPGSGSVFCVRLPQGTDQIDLPPVSSPAFLPSTGEKKRVVLLAGESQDINRLIEIYLTGGPFEAAIAADGVELLRKAAEESPFAIIMGVTIPKKDGWEALKELKAGASTSSIPVVMISSTDNKDLAMTLGAEDYIEKPVNREKLLAALGRLKDRPKA